MQYRCADVKDGTYFFTVNLAPRHLCLLLDPVGILREAVKTVKQRHPFHIDAFVVLPDHLHAIWTLPPGDADFSTRWMLIKSGFSRYITMNERRNASRISKGERGIWQRRYWEHLIRDENDFERHVDYIHYNPVKHGYIHQASEWPYSKAFTVYQGWRNHK
jgi:putative transposase